MAEFESEAHYHKRYCSHSCYLKAKVYRRIERDKANQEPQHTPEHDPRFIMTLSFPSKEQLYFACEFVTAERPAKIIGMRTHIEPPPTHKLVPQAKFDANETDTWLLTVKEEEVDLIKLALGQK